MIESITAINERNESIVMELANPYQNGLVIYNVTGLGPPKATINATEMASSDGSNYNSARASSRNIVLSLYLLPHPSTGLVETTRLLTYKYFPIKKPVTLYVKTDHRSAYIVGYVESNEPTIFETERESQQISIICPDSYLYADGRSGNLNSVIAEFEFPFSNESLTRSMLSFGEIVQDIGMDYNYEGDVDSGVYMSIHATGPAKNITVYNDITNENMSIDTSRLKSIVGDGNDDVIFGDDILLCTIPKEKSIRLLRNGVYYNILATLPKTTDWISIVRGPNRFGYFAEYGEDNLRLSVKTNILYEGV